jgi:hypothetical protein
MLIKFNLSIKVRRSLKLKACLLKLLRDYLKIISIHERINLNLKLSYQHNKKYRLNLSVVYEIKRIKTVILSKFTY